MTTTDIDNLSGHAAYLMRVWNAAPHGLNAGQIADKMNEFKHYGSDWSEESVAAFLAELKSKENFVYDRNGKLKENRRISGKCH